MSWIHTFTGKRFDLLAPDSGLVDLRDIAHALSNCCRFAGHTREFYSVAQHSVLVARACPPEHALLGLLHDAAEAYMGDQVRPLKQISPVRMCEIETGIQAAIWHAFRLDPTAEALQAVKYYDDLLLATEARDLLHGTEGWNARLPPPDSQRISAWSPEVSSLQFRLEFARLHCQAVPSGILATILQEDF